MVDLLCPGYSIPPGLSCTLPRPYSFPAACHRSFLSQWLAPPHVPWWPKELSAALEQDRKRQADSGWLDSRAPLICLLVAALRMRAGDLRIFILETPRQSSSTGLCASQLPRKFVPHFRQVWEPPALKFPWVFYRPSSDCPTQSGKSHFVGTEIRIVPWPVAVPCLLQHSH